jgi:hypothetical protein
MKPHVIEESVSDGRKEVFGNSATLPEHNKYNIPRRFPLFSF